MGRIVLGRPESSIFDLPNLLRGFRFSLDAMWTDVSRLNLLELAPTFQMPIFFFLGAATTGSRLRRVWPTSTR